MSALKWLIKSISFNTGEMIPVNAGDIVVFVGPNNAGKSQSLKDIYQLCGDITKGKVISTISTEKIPSDNFNKWLSTFSNNSQQDRSGISYQFLGTTLNTNWHNQFINSINWDSHFRTVLFSYLKTEERLNLVAPPPLLNKNEPRTHPIQIVKDNKDNRVSLSNYFHRTFSYELFPSIDTKNISLVLGSLPKFDNQENLTSIELAEKIKDCQNSMPVLEEQGDGMRSFTGILLNLLMPNYSVFFIDEPESFLHPPQAKILGEIMPEMIPADKQAFIATHSQDLLKGLIEKCPERVKIIRVTRLGDTNPVKLLKNDELSEVWKDSFMKYSNIIDSLFHESVVLCESDSDCKIYSMVLDEIKREQNKTNNTLFTYCGGKRRFPVVAKMLKALGVDFRMIPDLDFLNDKELIKITFEICEGDWAKIEPRYNDVKSGVEARDQRFTLADLKAACKAFIDSKGAPDDQEISKKDFETFKSSLKYPKGWDMVKHAGISMIPNGNPISSFHEIDKAFKSKGIFMPHVGELENFFPTIGSHGPKWADAVMEQYPSMSQRDKEAIKDFVTSLNL